jgi:hypothetical protein
MATGTLYTDKCHILSYYMSEVHASVKRDLKVCQKRPSTQTNAAKVCQKRPDLETKRELPSLSNLRSALVSKETERFR